MIDSYSSHNTETFSKTSCPNIIFTCKNYTYIFLHAWLALPPNFLILHAAKASEIKNLNRIIQMQAQSPDYTPKQIIVYTLFINPNVKCNSYEMLIN